MNSKILSAEDQIRAERKIIHEDAMRLRRHRIWCKPWENCTCHEVRTLAPRKPQKKFNPKDYGLGAVKDDPVNQTK